MARFASPERLACRAALSPGDNVAESTMAAKYKSLMMRKSHKKALVAVAHNIIRLICILLSRPAVPNVMLHVGGHGRVNLPVGFHGQGAQRHLGGIAGSLPCLRIAG